MTLSEDGVLTQRFKYLVSESRPLSSTMEILSAEVDEISIEVGLVKTKRKNSLTTG